MSHHALRPMTGRDPHESGRVASSLELLYDLTFVVAIGIGASYFAEVTAAGHVVDALIGFGFVMFAVPWTWINFSWFASAFDTDDWLYRLTTMVQMAGVVVLALGIPYAFESIEKGHHFDNKLMVLGYVVMRLGLVFHWWRASRGCDGDLRRTCLRYAVGVTVVQVLWVVYALAPMSIGTALVVAVPIIVVELLLPPWAERGAQTPWHPHHIAERYSLFAIIVLGEGVVGTAASSRDLVVGHGWTFDAVAVVVAGVGLTFGLWWVYFLCPFGEILHARRRASFWFGYGHLLVFAAIAAVGAGLHLAGLAIEGKSSLSAAATAAAFTVPVAAFVLVTFGLVAVTAGYFDRTHAVDVVLTVLLAAASIGAAAAGADIAVSLLIALLIPWVTVVTYEAFAHRDFGRAMDGLHG